MKKWISSKLLKKISWVKVIEIFLLILLGFFSILIGVVGGVVLSSYRSLPSLEQLSRARPKLPTKFYDINGKLIAEFYEQKRELVPLSDVPSYLIQAILVTEDPAFFKHFGLDPKGILRAAIKNILAGRIVEGGSTITQQLARSMFLTQERTFVRKIMEAILAVKIERVFSKEEILEMYLNQIYLGHGCYGVETASRFYFGKHVRDITLAEAALLAGLISSPNYYSPIRHPERARKKMMVVLKKMVKAGYVTPSEAQESFDRFWIAWENRRKTLTGISRARVDEAPYFTEYIRRYLEDNYGPDVLYNEGLQVYTTLDLDAQKAAAKTLREHLLKLNEVINKEQRYLLSVFVSKAAPMVELAGAVTFSGSFSPYYGISIERKKRAMSSVVDTLQMVSLINGFSRISFLIESYLEYAPVAERLPIEGALVAIDPATGYIKAMVGGSGFSPYNQLNRVTQARRQPGSAFKLFVYTAAIESRKYTPITLINDSPIVYTLDDGSTWIPENYEGTHLGWITVRRAIAKSVNVAAVKVADSIGIERVIDVARRMGIKSKLLPTLSLALGTSEVTPLELVSAYATVANYGYHMEPMAILQIEDREGNILEKNSPTGWRAIDPDVAYVMISLLTSVVRAGTAAYTVGAKFPYPAAGKTGTSDNWRDAWFIGFTPNLVAGVWVGYDRTAKSLGRGRSGGVVAAPIWTDFMLQVTKPPVPNFRVPSGVVFRTICKDSYRLARNGCPRTYQEVFLAGTEPKELCPLHQGAPLEPVEEEEITIP